MSNKTDIKESSDVDMSLVSQRLRLKISLHEMDETIYNTAANLQNKSCEKKSSETKPTVWLIETIWKIEVFKHLSDEQISEFVEAMYKCQTSADQYVFRQGDKGDEFFVIQKGVYHVVVTEGDGQLSLRQTYTDSGYFGELALLYDQPRAASVVSCADGILWAVDGQTFRRIVFNLERQGRREIFGRLLETVPVLEPLEPEQREHLADVLVPLVYKAREVIFEQQDEGDGMYFIVTGAVEIIVRTRGGKDVILSQLEPGDYFGELALVSQMPRAATAVAQRATTLAFLASEDFESLLESCKEGMKKNIDHYNQTLSNAILNLKSDKSQKNQKDLPFQGKTKSRSTI